MLLTNKSQQHETWQRRNARCSPVGIINIHTSLEHLIYFVYKTLTLIMKYKHINFRLHYSWSPPTKLKTEIDVISEVGQVELRITDETDFYLLQNILNHEIQCWTDVLIHNNLFPGRSVSASSIAELIKDTGWGVTWWRLWSKNMNFTETWPLILQ